MKKVFHFTRKEISYRAGENNSFCTQDRGKDLKAGISSGAIHASF